MKTLVSNSLQIVEQRLIDTRDIAYFIFVDVLFLQLARFKLAVERGRLGREFTKLIIMLSTAVVLLVAVSILKLTFDVTAEKRHTLTEGSILLLDKMDERKRKQLLHVIYTAISLLLGSV